MNLTETLKQLSSASGPSGSEDEARRLAARLLGEYIDQVSTDPMGNVIGLRKSGKPGAPRVLVEAHIDEIGFVVTGAREGFLTLAALGSVDPRHLPGARLRVLGDSPRVGVVACLPPHVLTADKMEGVIPLDEICLDIGAGQEEAERIPPGTPVVYDGAPLTMGDGLFSGKAMDNRASFAAVLLALEQLGDEALGADIYVMASVQEEVGCRGAVAGAYSVKPEYCIALDVTFAEQPDTRREQTVKFGGGAAIGVGPFLSRAMSERLKKIAEVEGILCQVEVLPGRSSTTADMVQISREGVATALISLPVKYMHSPAELISLADVESVARLLAAMLRDLGKGGRYA